MNIKKAEQFASLCGHEKIQTTRPVSRVHTNAITAIERKLNRRTVRKLNYLTPDDKYYSLVAVDA